MHSPSSAPIHNPHTGVLPHPRAARADLQELFLQLSPRLSVRVDTKNSSGQWQHKYIERSMHSLSDRAPRGPYAIYLSSFFRGFRWICFDLDTKRGDVGPDLATLLRWLEEAGLTYVVAASGSAGGRHVWVTAETLLDARLVESIAVAAAKRLPTLDYGLLKSRTGAVRPIGAPHRNGGRSELLSPLSQRRAAQLLTPATCGNPSDAFVRLLLVIDAVPAAEDIRPKLVGRDNFGQIIDDDGPRLAGTPKTVLDRETMALLTRRPPADRVSEVCASVLTRLALRRWSQPMVERLLEDRQYREGGLLHLCTSPGVGPLRVMLDQAEAEEKFERQWARCVAYAAKLPIPQESLEWTENLADVVALVEQLQQAADACPERWTSESGPADRAALDVFCLLALQSGSTVLSLDARRAALAAGYGRSTMSRAFRDRLSPDGWLARAENNGPANTYELLPITASHPAFTLVARGGTQRNLPPQGADRPTLISRLEKRLAAGQADLFAYGRATANHAGGLGHHAGRVYQQLILHADRALSLTELCGRTGYSARTVSKHLGRMQNLLVATRAVMTVHHECPTCEAVPGERCRTAAGAVLRRRGADQHAARQTLAAERSSTPYYRARPGALVAAAKALGCHGVTASRARRYAVEIELYRWWCQEEEWMRAPKAGIRTGVQTHPEQAALVLTTLARQPRRRYPRTADGRGDHAAARARIERRIATA
ncbi:zinc finger domain-containing protein [Streptomyces rugosispiralis]|uniref:Uncharacterized protein n=1 Tax=Streptomyces rugosispiralis TaxID=2967341 RepID=A0ABT1VB58_9ACTN|nr:hypothetical protein [Streptomyces rugosispiralis]MCQ8194630.1 hypothetical protein [Streptomyces rugosispiralis]